MRTVIAVPEAPVTLEIVGDTSDHEPAVDNVPELIAVPKPATLVLMVYAAGPEPVAREPNDTPVRLIAYPAFGVSVKLTYGELDELKVVLPVTFTALPIL